MYLKFISMSVLSFISTIAFAGGGPTDPPYCEQFKLPIVKVHGCTIGLIDSLDDQAIALDPKAAQAMHNLLQVGNVINGLGCHSPKGATFMEYGEITTPQSNKYPIFSYDNETTLEYMIQSSVNTEDHFPLATNILMKFEAPNKLIFVEQMFESLNPYKVEDLVVATVSCSK